MIESDVHDAFSTFTENDTTLFILFHRERHDFYFFYFFIFHQERHDAFFSFTENDTTLFSLSPRTTRRWVFFPLSPRTTRRFFLFRRERHDAFFSFTENNTTLSLLSPRTTGLFLFFHRERHDSFSSFTENAKDPRWCAEADSPPTQHHIHRQTIMSIQHPLTHTGSIISVKHGTRLTARPQRQPTPAVVSELHYSSLESAKQKR